jgi:hypothetical protein
MRRLIFTAIALGMTTAAAAQEHTLINGNVAIRAFGEPVAKYAWINEQSSLLAGGRGGVILNRSFVIGGAGYGLVNDVHGSPTGVGGPLALRFGYGGGTIEYIMMPDAVAHMSITSLVGAGGTSWVESRNRGFDDDRQVGRSDAFFVFEPGLNLEVNLTHGIRVNVGATYRLLSGVEQAGLRDSDLSGPSATFSVKLLGH